MRKIFNGKFEKQPKNLLNLTRGNLDISFTEIKNAQIEIHNLKVIIKHTEEMVTEEKVIEASKQNDTASD